MSQSQHRPRRASYEKLPLEGCDVDYVSSPRLPNALCLALHCGMILAVCLSLAGALIQATLSSNELSQAFSRAQGALGVDFVRTSRPLPKGFGLVYNSSYCNGVEDPHGACKRDCIFDPIHGGWIYRLCSDERLYEEFIGLPDFGWYMDPERTIRLPQEKVWQGEGGASTYTVDDFHYRHCEYILKSLFKNGQSDVRGLGFKLVDQEHLYHCLDRLVNYNTPEIRNAPTEQVIWTPSAPCYQRLK